MEIGYVNVFVSDLNRAVEFYKQKPGLVLEYSDHKYGYASFFAAPVRLGLAVAGDDQQELIGRHTGVGLAVTDLNLEDVDLEILEEIIVASWDHVKSKMK
jgi:catechol 2,3-dioxygenase-like lactoylglutathione lyase family enzyme